MTTRRFSNDVVDANAHPLVRIVAMTFSALDSGLTGPLFATDEVRAVFSDRSRLAAMLRVEAALARAEARHGLASDALAPAIEAISVDDLDIAAIGAATRSAGVPTIPFVKAVEALLPETERRDFHRSATSQDILDTALVLQIAQASDLIGGDLAAILSGLSRLAREYRTAPCAGRSYGQHAAPVTVGYVVGLWLAGIAEVAADLPRLRMRVLTLSLGGPVGTLADLGGKGPAVAAEMAAALGLAVTPLAWHVRRARIVETGLWLATLSAALAKMAADVSRLAATEVGEVAEPHAAGRGGSSAMPHKRNPVSSSVILAAHAAAKGHAVTLLDAAPAEYQRPVGLWHAEWHALPSLFGLASGALREARMLAEGLTVDAARAQENLEMTDGLLAAAAVASRLAADLGRDRAHAIVERAADTARAGGRHLREVLEEEPEIPTPLRRDLDACFDLAPAVAAAARATDAALAQAASVLAALTATEPRT